MHVGHGQSATSNTNGASTNGALTNGSTSRGKGRADGSNGFANGDSVVRFTNGDGGRMQPATYRGNDKNEVVRLMMQTLSDMGYGGAASALERDSGIEFESPSVAALRVAVLEGEWNEAETLLLGPDPTSSESSLDIDGPAGLPLKPGVVKDDLRLAIRRQKYLELLEERDHGSALMVLRHGLRPLNPSTDLLHTLSGLVVCPNAAELKRMARWQGAHGGSRQALLDELSLYIHHSVIVPPSRLSELLTQARRAWLSDCLWHSSGEPVSLFIDHTCDRDQVPPTPTKTLKQSGEVYHVAFSNSGRYLAACGQGKSAVIYEVGGDWEERYRLEGHTQDVCYVSWRPDDSFIVTCGMDRSARLWDMSNGACKSTLDNFTDPVTASAWLPDGSGFVTGSLDVLSPLLLWRMSDLLRPDYKPSVTIPANNFRVQDLAITPDGSKLLAISASEQLGHLSVFDLHSSDHKELFRLKFDVALTCVSISSDGRFALLNTSDNKLQCIEIDTMEIIQRYSGPPKGKFIIRSALGGAAENLVLSGSEDGSIYVFHRVRGFLIEKLVGHKVTDRGASDKSRNQCVNAISWNQHDACMFASCGDDGIIKIWSKGSNYTPATTRRTSSDLSFIQDSHDSAEAPPYQGRHSDRHESRRTSTSAAPTLL